MQITSVGNGAHEAVWKGKARRKRVPACNCSARGCAESQCVCQEECVCVRECSPVFVGKHNRELGQGKRREEGVETECASHPNTRLAATMLPIPVEARQSERQRDCHTCQP